MPLSGKRPGGQYCAVLGCHSSFGKLRAWKEQLCEVHGEEMGVCCKIKQPYQLHRFPKTKCDIDLWVIRLRRLDFHPNNDSRVCSLHFVDGKPTTANPNPEKYLGYSPKVIKRRRPPLVRGPPEKRLKPKASRESVVLDAETETSTDEIRTIDVECQTDFQLNNNCKCQVQNEHAYCAKVGTSDKQVQVSMSELCAKLLTPKKLKFFTGFTGEIYFKLASIFGERIGAFGKSYLPAEDQLLLIFLRIRLNLLMEDIANRFKISTPVCSKIFSDGIIVFEEVLDDAVVWLPNEVIRSSMPQQFKELYPGTTCVIDCSEILCQKPEALMARAKLYSNYKAHNTVKYLIGMSPSGFIMFVSKCYGGRASDKFICVHSKFFDYLEPGDEVMGDRGFDIEKDLAMRGIKLNIPAFTKGGKLTEFDCTKTRRIASIRIHIERVIGRLKNYRILKSVLP